MHELRGRPAIIYGRFSSKQQKSSTSRKRQIEQAMEFVIKYELVLLDDGVWFDAGVSGFRGKHRQQGELGKLLDAIQSATVPNDAVLIIESIDRLSRENPLDAFGLIKDVVDAGVSVVTIHDQQRYDRQRMQSDPSAIFLLIAGMQRANSEAEARSERSKANWVYKREMMSKGEAPRMQRPFWINLHGELIPERCVVVQSIFDKYINERKGIRPIARELNADQVPPPTTRAKEWRWAQISRILKDPRVLGLFGADMIYPPAIERAAFSEAQRIIQSQQGKGRVGKTWSSAVRGVADCERCGSPMKVHSARHGSRTMYCRRSLEGVCDTKGGINYKLVALLAVWAAAQDISYSQGQRKAATAQTRDVGPEINALDQEIDKLAELAALTGGVDKIAIKIRERQERKEQLLSEMEKQLTVVQSDSWAEQMDWLHNQMQEEVGAAVVEGDREASIRLNQKLTECGQKVTWDGEVLRAGEYIARRDYKSLIIEGEGAIKHTGYGTQELGGGWYFLANVKEATEN